MILWDCTRNIVSDSVKRGQRKLHSLDKSVKPAKVPVDFQGIRLLMDVSLDRIARVRTLPVDQMEEECTRG